MAMKKRVKLMIAALLGFSTACSTVKNGASEVSDEQQQNKAAAMARTAENGADSITQRAVTPEPIQRIKLMYGTPSPRLQVDTTRVEKQSEQE